MGSLYFGGLPTHIDVERIQKALGGIPKIGDVIEYATLEAAIERPRVSNRFRTVLQAWRRKLRREHNLELVPVDGGVKAANPAERIDYAGRGYEQGVRKVGRAGSLAARTTSKGLSEEQVRARDHLIRASSSVRLAAATQAKELPAPPWKK